MPCNQQRTVQIDLSKADPELLEAALKIAGFNVTPYPHNPGALYFSKPGLSGYFSPGEKLTLRGRVVDETKEGNAIRRAYSEAVLRAALTATSQVWDLEEETAKEGAKKSFAVVREGLFSDDDFSSNAQAGGEW